MTRRRGVIALVLLALVMLLPLIFIKLTRRSPAIAPPRAITTSSTTIPVEPKAPEESKAVPLAGPVKPPGEMTWQKLPKIVRYRNPKAANEGGSRQHEERILFEEGFTREEVAGFRAFINAIDRKLDEAFGALPLFAQHAGGDSKGGPDSQIRMLTSAACGQETIEGLDPAILRVRAICRLACYERNETSLAQLTALAGADPDPDIQVASAVTMAIWKEDGAVLTWMKSQQAEASVSAFISALQFPNIGGTHLGGGTYRERLIPRFSVELAQALVDARRASTDPLLRQRALNTLGLCSHGGRSAEAIEELFREAESPASRKTETFAYRGLMNALESETTRARLVEWAAGTDERRVGMSIMTLGKLLYADSVKGLGDLLNNSQGQRAQQIVSALSEAKGPMAPLALAELEKTSQTHAEEAIRNLATEKLETLRKRLKPARQGN